MNDEIIGLLAEHAEGLTKDQLMHELKLSSTDEASFEHALNDLIQGYDLVMTRKGRYILAKSRGILKGILHIVNKNFGFVDGEEHIFVKSEDFNHALHNDEVVVESSKSTHASREGKIIKVTQRNTEYLLATLVKGAAGYTLQPYGQKVVMPLSFVNPLNLELRDGLRYVVKILNVGKTIEVELSSLLGHKDDIGMDVLSVLMEYDIDPEYPEAALKEAQAIGPNLQEKDYANRTDLRDQLIFTIDGESAKDLDDAISLEKVGDLYRLGVHIADVSYYVKENGDLDQEAYARSTSTYVVDRVVPMLPFELSNGLCSLNPNVDRLAISCVMDIDDHANVVDYQIFPSVIHSKYRFTYTEVNRILEGESTNYPEHLLATMTAMKECSTLIRKRKIINGSIDFETSESEFILDDQGKVLEIFPSVHGEAETMIEDFMVCANECVAGYCRYHDFPILYRVHEKPVREKMQNFSLLARTLGYRMKGNLDEIKPKTVQKVLDHFQNDPSYSVISKIMLRSMSKARYDAQCLGHFGLALENYTHFTSPIRRYPDLIVHRTLHRYAFNHDRSHQAQDEAKRKEQAIHTSDRERVSIEAEREVEKIKKAQFMVDKVGATYDGLISGVTKFGLFVELENTVEGLVHVKTLNEYFDFDEIQMALISQDHKVSYRLGQKVRIKVKAVDLGESVIDFLLLDQRRPQRSSRYENRRRKP